MKSGVGLAPRWSAPSRTLFSRPPNRAAAPGQIWSLVASQAEWRECALHRSDRGTAVDSVVLLVKSVPRGISSSTIACTTAMSISAAGAMRATSAAIFVQCRNSLASPQARDRAANRWAPKYAVCASRRTSRLASARQWRLISRRLTIHRFNDLSPSHLSSSRPGRAATCVRDGSPKGEDSRSGLQRKPTARPKGRRPFMIAKGLARNRPIFQRGDHRSLMP